METKRDIDSFYHSLDEEIQRAIESCGHVLLPDINLSKRNALLENGDIRLGFDIINGISTKTIDEILLKREDGPFRSISDFLSRIPFIHRRADDLTMLVQSGCFDSMIPSRLSLLLAIEDLNLLKQLDAFWLHASQEALDLNGIEPSSDVAHPIFFDQDVLSRIEDPLPTLMEMEHRALRIHRSEIQSYPYKETLELIENLDPINMISTRSSYQYLAGIVKRIRTRDDLAGKSRNKMILDGTIETKIGSIDFRYITDKRSYRQSKITEDSLILIKISRSSKKETIVQAESVTLLPPASEMIKAVRLSIPKEELTTIKLHHLKAVLQSCSGIDTVILSTMTDGREFVTTLPIRVNSRNKTLYSWLTSIFDHVEMHIEDDEGIDLSDTYHPHE